MYFVRIVWSMRCQNDFNARFEYKRFVIDIALTYQMKIETKNGNHNQKSSRISLTTIAIH